MIEMIDSAEDHIQIELLSYSVLTYSDELFYDLDHALRRAGERGVTVELMLSDWAKREKSIHTLKSLQQEPNITVKLVTIPQWSEGFIPFARVIHSKYLFVDKSRAWVGTSNWSGDYFTQSRNVGLKIEGSQCLRTLDEVFYLVWDSEYAEEVDPDQEYYRPCISAPCQ